MQEFYINDDGIRLHAKLERPEGAEKCPLCIVIHGFTGHMEETHILAVSQALLECGIATLRVEMYGHGKSDGEFRNHTLYKWVTNALAVVDYAKTLDFVTDLYITGHSQGGRLTMLIAGMRPDDFKAVMPLSPAWMIPDGARMGNMLGIAYDPKHIPDELSNGMLNLSGNYIRVAQTIHPEEEIVRYEGPVLIIQGDRDEAVPLSYAEKAAELYKNAKLVIIPGDDHCYTKHLDQVVAAVKEYFS
jgi:pimeloyl-ACP methyl ester carboxylesterase